MINRLAIIAASFSMPLPGAPARDDEYVDGQDFKYTPR
jgi:hypothetical protein